MLKPSFERLLRTYQSTEAYLNSFKNSSLIQQWDDDIAAHFLYEIEKTDDGYRCNIPPGVIETEMSAMGASIKWKKMFFRTIRKPGKFILKMKANKRLPYHLITAPVLILVADKENVAPGDQLLPKSAVRQMLSRIPNARSMHFSDLNHYGILVADSAKRDRAVLDFFDRYT